MSGPKTCHYRLRAAHRREEKRRQAEERKRREELAARIAPYVKAPLHAARDVAAACAAAWQAATHADRVVIFGSFHAVAPAMDWLEAQGLLPAQSLREYTGPPSSS